MNSLEAISKSIKGNIAALETTFNDEAFAQLKKINQIVYDALVNGRKIILCGNGGSAADAQHIAAEFVGRFKKERRGYPAIALTTDTSILTAVGNDYGYENVFARQVEALAEEGDVLIGISTSGNSENVYRAMELANSMNVTTISFAGKDGGKNADVCVFQFVVPVEYTPYIQSGHIIALHTMCECVENMLTA